MCRQPGHKSAEIVFFSYFMSWRLSDSGAAFKTSGKSAVHLEEDGFCQTNQINGGRKMTFSHFLPILQCKTSAAVSSFYRHPYAKIRALNPSNNRNWCLEILHADGASSNYAPKGRIVHGDFFLRNLGYQGSLWTQSLPDSSWALKRKKFTFSGSFSCLYQHVCINSIPWLDKLYSW